MAYIDDESLQDSGEEATGGLGALSGQPIAAEPSYGVTERLNGAASALLSQGSISGAQPSGADLLRKYAQQMMNEAGDVNATRTRAYEAEKAAARKVGELSPGARAAPWLAFGAGMLAPNRSGSFSSNVATGADNLGKALEDQEKSMFNRTARAGMLEAGAEENRAKEASADRRAAVTALARANTAGAAGVASRFKIINTRDGGYMLDTQTLDDKGQPKVVFKADNYRDFMEKSWGLILKEIKDGKIVASNPEELQKYVRTKLAGAAKAFFPERFKDPNTTDPELEAFLSSKGRDLPLLPVAAGSAATPATNATPPTTSSGAGPSASVSAPTAQVGSTAVPAAPLWASFVPKPVRQPGLRIADPVKDEARKVATAQAEEDYTKTVLPMAQVAQRAEQDSKIWEQMAVQTGKAAPLQEFLGGWLDALGVQGGNMVGKAKDVQGLTSIMMNNVLAKQLEQKGVQTNSDANRMKDAWAQIRNTPEANKFIIRMTKAYADRSQEMVDFAEHPDHGYRKQHGGLSGYKQAFLNYGRNTPISGRVGGQLVFWPEFRDGFRRKYPDASTEDVMKEWRRYAS